MGRRKGTFNKAKQAAFLAAFEACAIVDRASRNSRVDKTDHYYWLKNDPEYPARFEKSEQIAIRAMEAEANRRAVEGLRKFKFNKHGEAYIDPETGEIYTEHVYSDVLLMFRLKALAPEKYRDNVNTTVSGTVQHNHAIEQLRAALDEARRDQSYVNIRRAAAIGYDPHTGVNGSNGVAGPMGANSASEFN